MIRIKLFLNTLWSTLVRCVNEVGTTNLFLLFVLALITLYPLFFVGFTTHDDVYFAINTWSGHIWEITKSMSMGQGRFHFLWGLPLGTLSYIIDNQVWYIVIKFGSIFLLLGALYYAVSKIFKSSWIAIVSLAFFWAIIQNGWEHNALTSYPFGFNFFGALFLLSLGLFATAIDKKSLALACFSGILYFFSFTTESFALFFPFYVAVLLSRAIHGESIVKYLKSGKKYILAIAIPWVAYLVTYLVWRHIYPSNYEGNILSGFNLLATIKVVLTYGLSAFPLSSLHFYTASGDPLSFTNLVSQHLILPSLSELNVTSIIKPLIVGFLFARLMTSVNFIVPKIRAIIIGAVLAFVGIFLPNLLLGFVGKYQGWVAGGSYSFVYTYYSFISAVVFLALLLAYVNVKSRLWHPKLRFAFISVVVVAVMFVSFMVDIRNQYIALDQKLAHRKWELMDAVIKSPSFAEIPNGTLIVAPTLFSSLRGIAHVNPDDWSSYVKYKTGKNVQFTDIKCQNESLCYNLIFRQESNSDAQFILLEKNKQVNSVISSEITVYLLPARDSSVIIGSFIPSGFVPKLEINGVSIPNVTKGVFSSILTSNSGDRSAIIAVITGNVDFIPERTTISNYSIEPKLLTPLEELGVGIDFRKQDYPDFLDEVSGISGYESWGRWTDATLGSVAKLHFKEALPKKFTLEINANAFGPNTGVPVKVKVGGVEKTFIITNKIESIPYHIVFDIYGTADTIEITPPNPVSPHEIDPKYSDPRKLGIGLISLKIIVPN